jgi:hypothetical protein
MLLRDAHRDCQLPEQGCRVVCDWRNITEFLGFARQAEMHLHVLETSTVNDQWPIWFG